MVDRNRSIGRQASAVCCPGPSGLADRSHKVHLHPWQIPAEVETAICEMRRKHTKWGPRRLVFEMDRRGHGTVTRVTLNAMNRGRPWTADDRTGGPVDELFDQLRRRIPALIVERLEVMHAPDDDNVYFIGDAQGPDRIQLDTLPDGQPTFYIENGGRHEATDVQEALDIISRDLEQSHP